ncbi:35131_t:CDS:2 [Gigaspora margarita]|uniref:35131_t:CDS:1 n=1 Tax=Gigaspora margarita TaxID=4874 RepID=A0ABN7V597_GIGMA|nr:35131_t:CDS:2 [Gigaspora margarita]
MWMDLMVIELYYCQFLMSHQALLYHEIFKQPPLSTIYNIKEIGINNNTNRDDISDEDWEKFVLKKSITTFYPSETIKMAPEFKVVDTSIFSYILTRNINAPIVMVAWRASRLIIKDYTRKNRYKLCWVDLQINAYQINISVWILLPKFIYELKSKSILTH